MMTRRETQCTWRVLKNYDCLFFPAMKIAVALILGHIWAQNLCDPSSVCVFGNKGMSVQLGKPLFEIVQSCRQPNKPTVESSSLPQCMTELNCYKPHCIPNILDDHFFFDAT